MNRVNPHLRHFAKRLIVFETRGNKSSTTETPAAFSAFEKLRPQLATLMGEGGFRALLARALALAGREVPWLRAVLVKADGSLEGLVEPLQKPPGPDALLEGGVVLLAQLLGLLAAFIGENLKVLKIIKADPDLKTIPVVVLTSSREAPDLNEFYQHGVNAYVVKPVDVPEFMKAVEQLGVFWAAVNEPPPDSGTESTTLQSRKVV
jgi:CheY-like chemotaxis protein